MSTTVSGFDYPGDKIVSMNNFKIMSLLIPAFLADTLFFSFLDYFHLNFANLLFYMSLDQNAFSGSTTGFFMLILLAICRPIFKIYISMMILEESINTLKLSYKNILRKVKYFIPLSLGLEFVSGIFLLGTMLLLPALVFLPLLVFGLVYLFYLAAAIILAGVIIALLIILIHIPLTEFQMVEIVILFCFIATLFFLRTFYNEFRTKETDYPLKKGHSEPIKSINVINKKHSLFILYGRYIITAKGKKLNIFANDQIKQPVFILKGHRKEIENLFITNNYLLSLDSAGKNLGIWDMSNLFKFQMNDTLTSTNGEAKNIQVVRDILYFNIKNNIYKKGFSFNEKSQKIIKVRNGLLEKFKVYEGMLYCILSDLESNTRIIQIWNLDTNELISELTEMDEKTLNLDSINVSGSILIINYNKKVILYRNRSKIEKIKEISFPNNIYEIISNDNFILVNTLKNKKGKKDSKINVLGIYASSTSFAMINEFHIKDFMNFSLTNDNYLLGDRRKKIIYKYSLNELVSI